MIGVVRVATGAGGLGLAAFGVVRLLELGGENLRAAGTWLIGGVVLHDAVLAPATLLLWLLVVRVLGRKPPAAVIVGAVVLATTTLVAVPVLGREQARPDNATLLDRDYLLGWFVLAGLTLLLVAGALLRARFSRRGGGDGARAGRR